MPLYAKGHSQGEYIFDHNWAHAWERAGGRYYPKLQAAVPFTPATGRRFLTRPGFEEEGRAALLQGALTLARRTDVSGWHVTFCTEAERDWGEAAGLMARTTQQFHWQNRGYPDFDAFLADLASRKRKAIRKERAARPGIRRRDRGADRRRAGARALGRLLALLPGHRQPQVGPPLPDPRLLRPGAGDACATTSCSSSPAAAAAGSRGRSTSSAATRSSAATGDASRTIPACISSSATTRRSTGRSPHGLARVEAGAQGEHKLARGYLPAATHSLHWIADEGFARAVAQYLEAEARAVDEEIEVLTAYGPFRRGPAEGPEPE